jgi:hypothetical protein
MDNHLAYFLINFGEYKFTNEMRQSQIIHSLSSDELVVVVNILVVAFFKLLCQPVEESTPPGSGTKSLKFSLLVA